MPSCLQRCSPSRRSHHGAAVSHLLQELQQGQILISRKILHCILGGLQRDHGDLPCLVATTAIGIDVIQGLQIPRVTSARANCTHAPCSPCSAQGCLPANPKTQKPLGKNSCIKTKVSVKSCARILPGWEQRGALPGVAGHKDQPAPTLRLEAAMPCRESQEPWVGPEEGDEAVSLQQHAQERPPHEDDEDPSHEEAGALQLWPLEKES